MNLVLGTRSINEFLVDMAEMQCLSPICEPRVTEHIEHIIELISDVLFTCAENATNLAAIFFLCCLFRKIQTAEYH